MISRIQIDCEKRPCHLQCNTLSFQNKNHLQLFIKNKRSPIGYGFYYSKISKSKYFSNYCDQRAYRVINRDPLKLSQIKETSRASTIDKQIP